MSFALFLLYLFVVIVRPIEALELDVGNLRPMLVLWLLAFVLAAVRASTKQEIAARPAHYLLFAMLLLAIVASQIRQGWLGGALAGFMEFSTSAGLFFLVALNVTTMRRLKAACLVLLLSIVVVSSLSVYAYHTGFMAEQLVLRQGIDFEGAEASFRPGEITSPAADHSGLSLWRIRGLGFMNDPNDLAQAVVMVLPLLWGLRVAGRHLLNLLIVGLPGALLGYTIYLTHSRGAIIGVASLFFFGLHKWLGTVKTALLVALVGASPMLLQFGGGRGFSSGEKSAGERIEAWYEGLQMFKHNPIFGVGYGNFLDHHYLTAHNSFVLAFAELGLVGYFAWVGVIVATYQGLRLVIARASLRSDEYRLAILLRASLIGFLTCAWFLSRTYQATLFVVLGLCAAVWFIWLQRLRAEPARGRAASVEPAGAAARAVKPTSAMSLPGMAKITAAGARASKRQDASGPPVTAAGPSGVAAGNPALVAAGACDSAAFEIHDGRRRYVPVALRRARREIDPSLARVTHPAWFGATLATMALGLLAVYLFVLLDKMLVQ